jgi:hypothetical protein
MHKTANINGTDAAPINFRVWPTELAWTKNKMKAKTHPPIAGTKDAAAERRICAVTLSRCPASTQAAYLAPSCATYGNLRSKNKKLLHRQYPKL